ncbi:MAG: hypothetical protein Q9178_001186 [Gyalolechia marmorata]
MFVALVLAIALQTIALHPAINVQNVILDGEPNGLLGRSVRLMYVARSSVRQILFLQPRLEDSFSKGFCGTTSDFCGTEQVKKPSCSGTSSNQRTIGYYEGWSTTRACDQMYPEDLPVGAYTHINFAFAFIDPVSFAVAPMSDDQVPLFARTTGLKNRAPGLEVWISIGGWSMNDPDQPTHSTFSQLAASADAQSKFFASLLSFMQTYGFDGVDMDWEYPVAPERSGHPDDFKNYVTFLKNLRNAFGSSGHKYGLSLTLPSSYWYLQHFDIVALEEVVDWFNLMSYDLHGTWDSSNRYIGSIVGAHTNLTEIDLALQLLWRNDIDPGKVILGLGYYGRSFTLSDSSCSTPGCSFSGGAAAGECTGNVGTLSLPEINRIIAKGATVTLDKAAAVKQAVFDTNQWVSYDDSETFKMKVDYANGLCLGGTMVWAASLDDKKGSSASSLAGVTGRSALSLKSLSTANDPITSCQMSECGHGKNCPPGTKAVVLGNHPKQNVAIGIKQGNLACGALDEHREYCCPINDAPTCVWRGKAPLCRNAKCEDGEVEITSGLNGDGSDCWFNHKVLCCKSTASDAALSACPANDPAVQDFSTQLDAFLADPVCKGGRSGLVKRALSDSKGLMKARSLSPTIAGASLLTTGLDFLLSNVFDLKFGNGVNVHFASIVTQSNNFPGLDKNSIALDALCTGEQFANALSAYGPANTEICVLGPGRRSQRRDLTTSVVQNNEPVGKRNWWMGNSITDAPGTTANPSDRPYTGSLLEQFTGGGLDVVYQRIVRLGPNQRNHMLLEMALDIRQHPALQQSPDDILAVIHMHIDTAATDYTGNYAGVQFISIFHAQQIYRVTATGDYRAVVWNTGAGRINTNERAAVNECGPDDPSQRWWPGWEDDSNEADNVVLEFGRALRARGYMTDNILEGYYDAATFEPYANGADQYGFTYNSPRAQARVRSFLPSSDGHYNGVPDFSAFMRNLYQPQPPAPGNQPYGGGDPIKF